MMNGTTASSLSGFIHKLMYIITMKKKEKREKNKMSCISTKGTVPRDIGQARAKKN